MACEWRPVLASGLPEGVGPWLCAADRAGAIGHVEREAARLELQEVRWPPQVPFDSEFAMRVATYARQIGRTVPFAQAAFRQAYAGARDLTVPDNVLIAASACEMHPAAVLKSVELRSVQREMDRTLAEALERGVRRVPAITTAGGVFHGDEAVTAAADALT